MTIEELLYDYDFQKIGKIDSGNACLCEDGDNMRSGFDADATKENYAYWILRLLSKDKFRDFRLEQIIRTNGEGYYLIVKSQKLGNFACSEYKLRGDTLVTYKTENARFRNRKRSGIENHIKKLMELNVQICHEHIVNPHFCMNMPPIPHVTRKNNRKWESINTLRATAYNDRPDMFLKTVKAVFDNSCKTNVPKLLDNTDVYSWLGLTENKKEAEKLLIDLLWEAKIFFDEFEDFNEYCDVFHMDKFLDENGEVKDLPHDFYEYVEECQKLLGRLPGPVNKQ